MRQDGVSSEEHMPRYDALRRNALVRTFRVAAKQGCRASKAVCSHTERGNKAMAPKQCRLYLCRGPKGAEPDSPGHRPGLWSPLKMLQGPTGRNHSSCGPLGLTTINRIGFPGRCPGLDDRKGLRPTNTNSSPHGDPLAQEVRLKPARQYARKPAKTIRPTKTAQNDLNRITPESEFFNMPPKGAWQVTQNGVVETYCRQSGCIFSTCRNFFTALFKRRILKNSFLVKNSSRDGEKPFFW